MPKPQPAVMTDAVLEAFIRDYIASSPGPVVSFTWHGGEPTLAGLDFYRRAAALQQQYLPRGWTCWNNLQTNGLLLDDAWCAFLAEHRFDVGLSLDGTRANHDRFRTDRGGAGTYERAAEAVRRLQRHGLQPDLLCTVTSSAAEEPLAVYRALRDMGTGWMQFIPIVRRTPQGGLTEDSVTAEAYGDFLCDIFHEWIHHDLGHTEVQLFAEMARAWSGGEAALCWMAPVCGRVLVVEKDGGVYACDHFVRPDHRLGSVLTSSLADLADSPRQKAFGHAKRDALPGMCLACPHRAVCGGGCPKDRFAVTPDGEPGLNVLCAGLRKFFSYAEKPARRALALTARGMPPGAVMETLRAEEEARWRGIGKSSPCPCGSGKKARDCCWNRRRGG